jgi:hypothetical protein
MQTISSYLKSAAPIAALGLAYLATSITSLAAPAPKPVLTISIPAEINLGDTAMIIVNAKYAGVNIPNLPISHVSLQFPLDPVTQIPLGDTIQLLNVLNLGTLFTDANGDVAVQFDPATLNIPANCGYTIRAQSGNLSPLTSHHTVSLGFCVKEASCGAPFSFGLTDVSGPGELLVSTKTVKYPGAWDLTYTVKACQPIVAGTKVQGGLVGWATYGGAVVTAGSFTTSTKNKNTVITWILPAMAAGDEHTITIHLSGNSSTVVGTQMLSGAWSAVYQTLAEANNIDSITGLPAPIPPHKSEYTPRASYEVVNVLSTP